MIHSPHCLTENEVLSWVGGTLSAERVRELELHLDACDECIALVGEALRDSPDGAPIGRHEETFRPDELVADRYRIVRFLARGGMGEVYEVYDSWLRHSVALKTLVAHISDDPLALARLKAEVLVARRVSHRNVCRIFDLGFHDRRPSPASSKVERVAFLTMEFLAGETLRARVVRDGRLGTREARPLLLQLVAGLGHAHAMGVVHRDFKSVNVMLVEESGAVRAVITDFGLARDVLRDSSQGPLTSRSNQAVGTLDYMAPEQVAGKPATRESDVYALGVVLFEMVTGRLPFVGGTPLARALKRAQTAAPLPSGFAPDIGREWDTAIRRCLEVEPADRFARVEDVARHLTNDDAGTRPNPKRRRLLFAILLASTALVAWLSMHGSADPHPPKLAASPPKAVAPLVASVIAAPSPPTPPEAPPAEIPVPPAAVTQRPTPLGSSSPKPRRARPPHEQKPSPPADAPPAHAADGLLDPFGSN